MKTKQTKSNCMLMLSALIWGIAFVAQAVGMEYIGPFTFNAVRNFVGAIVLIPCILYFDRSKTAQRAAAPRNNGVLLAGGICCGIALAVGSSLQQIGLQYTTVGKAGFLTALYIVIVPLLGIFLKKKIGALVWLAVGLALGGMYLLCITESFSIATGDLYVLACSLIFSLHILVIDFFAPMVDGIRMSCIQFFVCGLISTVAMFIFEQPSLTAIASAWIPICYTGIFSSGIAYTIQVVAQKNTDPTVACLVLSLESVFSVLAGWILLQQALSPREIFGCILVFCAIVLAQTPPGLLQKYFVFRRRASQ